MTAPKNPRPDPRRRSGDRRAAGTAAVVLRAPAAEVEGWREEARANGWTLTRWIREMLAPDKTHQAPQP